MGKINIHLRAIIDRPVGYIHNGTVYQLNYGFIEGLFAGDGEEQDVYILSRKVENLVPLSSFEGVLYAIIHRLNDVEDKWVLTTDAEDFTSEEIAKATFFQEQYFTSKIELIN